MRFHVVGELTITVTTIVDAPDEATAREIASERGTGRNWRDDSDPAAVWVHDDLDGEPVVLEVRPIGKASSHP